MGSLLGSPGPWLAVFSPWGMCRAPNCLLALEAFAQVASEVRHSSALLVLGPLGGGGRWSENLLDVSVLHPPSGLPAPPPFSVTCHQSWTI